MGGLKKYMPITYWTMVIGSLALAGVPPFAGFFSKDAIIEAVQLSKVPGHGYALFAVTAAVFLTALYSFRLIFMAFHGEERFRHAAEPDAAHGDEEPGHDEHGHAEPHESPWVMVVPLIILGILSLVGGWIGVPKALGG